MSGRRETGRRGHPNLDEARYFDIGLPDADEYQVSSPTGAGTCCMGPRRGKAKFPCGHDEDTVLFALTRFSFYVNAAMEALQRGSTNVSSPKGHRIKNRNNNPERAFVRRANVLMPAPN